MDRRVEQRLATWWHVGKELLQQSTTDFPVEVICQTLLSTFDVTGVYWSWRAPNGSFGLAAVPRTLSHACDGWDLWEQGKLFDIHPLARWHLVTNDLRPQSASRVPDALVSRQDREFLRGVLRSFGCEEQLSIACRINGSEHETFVLARSGSDFSDGDLIVAQNAQPALMAIHHHVDLMRRVGADQATSAADLGMTPRELAVLRLLSDGYSTRGIARRLMTSPRTVEKHLEHVYRKVNVKDRVSAVRAAEKFGLLSTRPLRGSTTVTSKHRQGSMGW